VTTRISGGTPLDGEPGEHGELIDLSALYEDDLLLDQLGRGEEPDDGDAVAATLSRWRATLPAAGPTDDELLDSALAALRSGNRTRRLARGSVFVSIVAVLVGGAVTAAAEHAGPGSPLWPVTQLVFHDLAEARAAAEAAGDSIGAARAAIDGGHYVEAAGLLDDAAGFIARMDREDASRLRADIASLLARIPVDADEPAPDPGPGPGAAPDGTAPPSRTPGLPTVTVPSSPTVNTEVGRPSVGVSVAPSVASSTVGVVPPLVPVGPVLSAVPLPIPDVTIGVAR
jgi:hypothetical protein